MSAAILFFTLDYFFNDPLLHLLRAVHVSVHRKGGGGVTKTHLYLFRADFLLSEYRRMRMAEGMKAQVSW